MKKLKPLLIPAGLTLLAVASVLLVLLLGNRRTADQSIEDTEFTQAANLLYGIDADRYNISEGTIGNGETMGQIFARFGVGAAMTDRIARAAEPVFSLRNIRAGHNFTAFSTPDSLQRLDYFVYEATLTDYLVIDLTQPDSVAVHIDQKEVRTERVKQSGTITSSLWNCMIENGMSPALAMDLSDIYAWSIDFFGLQKDDKFTVIYDQKYIDTVNIGAGTIWGAWFEHGGKVYNAIPFIQDDKLSYWDEEGNSLRKAFLKAPLKFSRISSRFSNSRLHPILKIRRPHHGVDYAAPAGTPVVAVGDGVVIAKGYAGGGGNTIKIRHNTGKLVSSYLHLKGFAKGISVGSRVSQGQLIGYVGSTGLSTGPHLDFRIHQNGTPIDPLKIPSEPAEPIRAENKLLFESVKNRVMAELGGEVPDSLRVNSLDQLRRVPVKTAQNPASAATAPAGGSVSGGES